MKKRTYHGWVVVEESGDKAVQNVIWVEYTSGDGKRRRTEMNRRGERGCVEAMEWWDKRTGTIVNLEPTMKGCYRVFTETREEVVITNEVSHVQ